MKITFNRRWTADGRRFPYLRSSAFICGLLFFLFAYAAQAASTVISGTLSITNYSALTNATSGQKYTLNGDARTFTNSLASPSTQIRVQTNDSAATILLSLAGQAGAYPFTAIASITTSAGTNVTFRATADTALTIALSPTNWGRVTYSTQTLATPQTIVRVPISAESSTSRTNIATQLWTGLDTYSQARALGAVDLTGPITAASRADFAGRAAFNAGLALHGVAKTSSYTITTNDLYIGADTRSNTNLILTLPSASSSSNLLFLLKDEGGAGATNTLKIHPASGDRIDTLLTNLVVSNNFGGVILYSRGSTNWAVIASGGGVSGGTGGSGGGVPLTNSVWVAKNGNDSTGVRGDASKPYLTLGAAKTNATSGDTVFVMPGLYPEFNLNKTGVNWHFFNGSTVSNISDSFAIFDYSVTAANFNVTGDGVFLDNTNGFGGIIYCNDAGSVSSFRFKRMWSDGNPVILTDGTFTLSGDIIESDANIGAQGVTRIAGSGAALTILRTKLRNNGSGSGAKAIGYTTANTNLVLSDSVLLAGSGANAIDGSGTTLVTIEGGYTANAGVNANVTIVSTEKFWTPAGNIVAGGYLSLSGQTNQIADNGTALTFNGAPVGGILSVNGTQVSAPNFIDSATAILDLSDTNISVFPTNLADAQIASDAAIDPSKISGLIDDLAAKQPASANLTNWSAIATSTKQPASANLTNWSALATSTRVASAGDTMSAGGLTNRFDGFVGNGAGLTNLALTTIADGGNSSLRLKAYIVLASPFNCDGVGAIINPTNTLAYVGQALFSGTIAATTNWVEYRITVPEDFDNTVSMKVERFKFRLSGTDTAAHSYVLSMAAVADSASYDAPTLVDPITLSFAGDGSGTGGAVETISSVTLTNWASDLTALAGRLWVIRLARNGNTDASTVGSYSGPLVLSYGVTQ